MSPNSSSRVKSREEKINELIKQRLVSKENVHDDDILYGDRRRALELVQQIYLGYRAQCVIYGINNFVNSNLEWGIEHIINNDPRIKLMFENLGIKHAYAIQRFTWPLMNKATYPCLSIAPEIQGKTYTHLLYIVAKIIGETPIGATNSILDQQQTIAQIGEQDKTTVLDSLKIAKEKDMRQAALPNIEDQGNFDFDALLKSQPPTVSIGHHDEQANTNDPFDDMQDINPDDFINHPKYIIICSNDQLVERIQRDIEKIKEAAFGQRCSESAKLHQLPPIIKIVTLEHSQEKLALRCNESEILIGTPNSLLKCLQSNFIRLNLCRQVIFDDLDLLLQLQNLKVREIIKFYLEQVDDSGGSETLFNGACVGDRKSQVFMFSRKWTSLVKQFVSSIFSQRIMIFSSLAEAATYANMKYEVELCPSFEDSVLMKKIVDISKLLVANNHTSSIFERDKVVIVTRNMKEAELVLKELGHHSVDAQILNQRHLTPTMIYELKNNLQSGDKTRFIIHIICDESLDFLVEYYNDMTYLIHYTLPNSMLTFDKRFELMYSNIRDPKRNLRTTLLLSPKLGHKCAKELYDLVSRSTGTLKSAVLTLRDLINDKSLNLCWRWSSTGICKLDKRRRAETFGSFCQEKHSVDLPNESFVNKIGGQEIPTSSGQFKVTVTRAVSPNEFYFRFEAYRDFNSSRWLVIKNSGKEYMANLQKELNKHRETPLYDVNLDKFKKGKIYGMYQQQELRVDRIVLLEEPVKTRRNYEQINRWQRRGYMPNLEALYQEEYAKQYEVFKIDYGIRLFVYLRNIFELPGHLAEGTEPQAHRAFLIGVKPCHNEPNWSHSASKSFQDMLLAKDVLDTTVWLRLTSNNCYWFEKMLLVKELALENELTSAFQEDPLQKLCQDNLAEVCVKTPPFLPYSDRLVLQSKWSCEENKKHAQFAYLRKDRNIGHEIFVLHIDPQLDLRIRLYDYNKALIDLEANLMKQFVAGSLTKLSYLERDVYCLAKLNVNSHSVAINRCKIVGTINSPREADDDAQSKYYPSRYLIECLDHGDSFSVVSDNLYLAKPEHFRRLPFQSIYCKLAKINQDLLDDEDAVDSIREVVYDLTRDKNDSMQKVKLMFSDETLASPAGSNRPDEVYLYFKIEKSTTAKERASGGTVYRPLISILEDDHGIYQIVKDKSEDLRKNLVFKDEEDLMKTDRPVNVLILNMLSDIIREELSKKNVPA